MRDQALDKDMRRFTSGLIRAIEELEVRRATRSPQQLADAAWQKLQYDFPLVETCELQALLEAFRSVWLASCAHTWDSDPLCLSHTAQCAATQCSSVPHNHKPC